MPNYGYLLPTRGSVLSSDDAQTLAAKTAADVVGLAGRAEAIGFDSVWVGDSVLAKPRHEPFTTLAAVATATESVGLGTAVHLPALRDPVHVAHQTATLDQLSGGRFQWGVGVGIGSGVATEHENLGVPYEERGPRLDELLEVVTALWSGEPVDYDGRFYRLEDASIGFEPVGEPPIYLATAGYSADEGIPDPIRERLTAHGDGWLPIALSPTEYAESLGEVEGALEAAGRSTDAFDSGLYLDMVIDDDEERALERASAFYEQYYPDLDTSGDGAARQLDAYGPAENVAETLAQFEDAGVETFVVRFSAQDQRTQLQRFAEIVG